MNYEMLDQNSVNIAKKQNMNKDNDLFVFVQGAFLRSRCNNESKVQYLYPKNASYHLPSNK